MQIQVDVNACLGQAQEMEYREAALKKLCAQLDEICLWQRSQISQADTALLQKLENEEQAFENVCYRLTVMKKTLRRCMELYRQTEDELLAQEDENSFFFGKSGRKETIRPVHFHIPGIEELFQET